MNIERSRRKLIIELSYLSNIGLIVEDEDYEICTKTHYLFSYPESLIALETDINNYSDVKLSSEIKEAIEKIDCVYNNWKENAEEFSSIEKELRNCAHPRITENFNKLAKRCSNDYIEQNKRSDRILRKKEFENFDRKRIELSNFLADNRIFYMDIRQEIANSHPIYLKIRYIYEHLTFQAVKNENKRRQDYCYHEIWRKTYDNYCECISCDKEEPCQYETTNLLNRAETCIRCGNKFCL